MTLGERIVNLRTVRGISQSDLAEAMEVSRQSVSKWETGTSTPDLEKLIKLADYFDLTLDQLVKGNIPKESAPPEPLPEPIDEILAPKRTKAKSLGLFFLGLSAFAAILSVVFLGVVGLIFVIPFLLFGFICYFAQNRPILKAIWADYLLLSVYFHYCTAISPYHILMTFRWTERMNYWILVFSWVWFFIIVALVTGTAITFRQGGWAWTKKQIRLCCSGVALYALSWIWGGVLTIFAPRPLYLLYVLHSYFQLAGITILAVCLAKWIYSKKKTA